MPRMTKNFEIDIFFIISYASLVDNRSSGRRILSHRKLINHSQLFFSYSTVIS